MFSAELSLCGKNGEVLWQRSIDLPSSGQVSVGRSRACDLHIDRFASSEWLLVSVVDGFISISAQGISNFGYLACELMLRRERKFSARISEHSPALVTVIGSECDVEWEKIIDIFPPRDVCLDEKIRAVVGEVLIDVDPFLAVKNGNKKIPVQDFIKRVDRVFSKDLPRQLSQHEQLQMFKNIFLLVLSYVYAEGPLTPWVRCRAVREVLLHGHDQCWVERERGLESTHSPFESWDDLWAWLNRAAAVAGRELVTQRGCSDFTLRSGARVHVVLSPVARVPGYVSIRCHNGSSLTLKDMVDAGTLSFEQYNTLEGWIRSKMNILVVGATTSGKTTLVRAMAEAIGTNERIVILEDVAEIRLRHEQTVYLQTVESSSQNSGHSVTLEGLVREALRMRPDRLIVGECRGHEAFALIQALHTGHRGSFSTLHANSARDALHRLETLVQRAEPSLSSLLARNLVISAFDAVVFVQRGEDSRRGVAGLHRMEELT